MPESQRSGGVSCALCSLLAAASLCGSPAWGIWSLDPANNLVLADGASEQVQPKIVARDDGGFYVSWFDNAAGGYDVRLQRLSALGVELWPHNGILVADRNLSSTTDYGLAVDAAGNALLAFNDDSQPAERIVAAKISPAGVPLWGTPGVAVSNSTAFLASPRIAGTDDGEVVVAWFQDPDTVLQRLDPSGAALWAPGGIALAHSGDTFVLSDLQATGSNGGLDSGNVIVSWVRYVAFQGAKHLWAQKLDADGLPLWGAGHKQVFDLAGGSLQFGNFPGFETDHAGGAVFAWYTSTPALQVRAQHLLGAGTEAFAHDGVEVSTDSSRLRVDPAAAYDSSTGDTTVFWVEKNSLQSEHGLYGQRLDASGNRLWDATGIAFLPLSGTEVGQLVALSVPAAMVDTIGPVPPLPEDSLVAWAATEDFDNQPIRVARIDSVGAHAWDPTTVAIKTSATSTSRLAAALSSDGFAAFAWTDGESLRDLEAQNLQFDGTVGTPPLFADGFEAGTTAAWSAAVP
jgi:hypothetical protein